MPTHAAPTARLAACAALLLLSACGSRSDAQSPRAASDSGAGVVCNDPALIGRPVGRVGADAAIAECGAPNAVRLERAAGVALEPAAIVNCDVAQALADWVREGVQPAAQDAFGRPVVALKVAASYACRTRNGLPGGKLSEHARANAIDIAGFRLAEKGRVPVLGGWSDPRSADFLRAAWTAACGPFGTVLGPEADKYHQNHFHFDAKSRRAPYCQ